MLQYAKVDSLITPLPSFPIGPAENRPTSILDSLTILIPISISFPRLSLLLSPLLTELTR